MDNKQNDGAEQFWLSLLGGDSFSPSHVPITNINIIRYLDLPSYFVIIILWDVIPAEGSSCIDFLMVKFELNMYVPSTSKVDEK